MKYDILHRSSGRLRIHIRDFKPDERKAADLTVYFESMENVKKVSVHDRTGNMILVYSGSETAMLAAVSAYSRETARVDTDLTDARLNTLMLDRQYQDTLVRSVIFRAVNIVLLPAPLRAAVTVYMSAKYILKGIRALLSRRVDVSVLDAVAIATSIIRRDFNTAGSVMFLLGVSEILEEWTHRKSVDDLARTMSLNVEKAWVVRDGEQILVTLDQIAEGEEIVVRMGNVIPLDGKVTRGEMEVNQASMTGEAMPVPKSAGF